MLSLSLIAGGIIGALGIGAMYRIFQGWTPTKVRVKKDIQLIETEMKPFISELFPIKDSELEQFGAHFQPNKTSLSKKTNIGTLRTIYHEILVVFGYKFYGTTNNNFFLSARTANYHFFYRLEKKALMSVFVDGNLIGHLDSKGALLGARSKRPIAAILPPKGHYAPIVVNDKELGSLMLINPSDFPNPRAFDFLKPMTEEEKMVFLALILPELILRQVKK